MSIMNISLRDVTLTPAYGRDYKSATLAIKDFKDGKDFRYNHFTGESAYCSIRDFVADGVRTAKIRYNKLTKVTTVKVS